MVHVLCLNPTLMTTWVPTAFRTHTLGELQEKGADLVGKDVTVIGFMEANRGKGKICFMDVRDGTGKVQVFLKQGGVSDEELAIAQGLSRESTVQIIGEVAQKRPPKVAEGEPAPPPSYEVVASKFVVLAQADTCLLYTSPSPRDKRQSRMPSSA